MPTLRLMDHSRPVLNITRLRGRIGNKTIAIEVVLLGPNTSEPLSPYVARLCPVPGEQPIELDVDALLRALTPAAPPAD
jgi:hypothetical protein